MSESLPPNPDPLLNVAIMPELIAKHGLSQEEYDHVVELIGREPSLTELGIFSVMWSEHCSYKNSRPLLKLFPTQKADAQSPNQVLVKAGEENAGVVDIGDGYAVCFKIESHNHPSAIEPYEGAATGVGGIVRDIFTMGARPALLTNSLRFGDLSSPTVRRLFRGVVHGISNYGNCLGIPNVGGDVYFDPCYEGNPLVNAQCLGVVKVDEIKRGAAEGIGNPVYYVGAATGRDGLGGAAFASKDLSEESREDRPAVQKGDPFMEKLLLEACLEMMQVEGLVVGIQDMGAAGLTCSTCETASRGGTGIEIELDLVPQRETGMNSYEIMLSESQERMLVIVQKGRESEIEEIFEKWDLHAAKVGEVKPGTDMVVKQGGVTVAHLPAAALADEAPVYHREERRPASLDETQAWTAEANLPTPTDAQLTEALPKLLAHPTIAHKGWVWQQYDHQVMAGTALVPGSDAGVIRIRTEAGDKYIAIANDCNNRYCALNPRRGGQIAMAECLRNLACSGARPLGMTDNLNFGNPHKPENFYAMAEAVRGLAEVCAHFDVPCVGGNVSLYNENPQGAIDPTPVITIAGQIEREEMITSQYLKRGDEVLLLLGGYPDELGASYYLQVMHGLKTGDAPALDLDAEAKLHAFLLQEIGAGHVAAAHDLSEGGLLVALAEMCFAKGATFGAKIGFDCGSWDGRMDALLYGESQSRAIIAVKEEDLEAIFTAAKEVGIPCQQIGYATAEAQLLAGELSWDVVALRKAYEEAIPAAMAM